MAELDRYTYRPNMYLCDSNVAEVLHLAFKDKLCS